LKSKRKEKKKKSFILHPSFSFSFSLLVSGGRLGGGRWWVLFVWWHHVSQVGVLEERNDAIGDDLTSLFSPHSQNAID